MTDDFSGMWFYLFYLFTLMKMVFLLAVTLRQLKETIWKPLIFHSMVNIKYLIYK